jgi:hypothetical protein
VDAVRAGREALACDHLTSPRRASVGTAKRCGCCTAPAPLSWPAGADARRQLEGPDRHRPEPLCDSLGGRPWRQQLGACTELVSAPGDPVEHRATVGVLALTA